jgi:hypothetical protein
MGCRQCLWSECPGNAVVASTGVQLPRAVRYWACPSLPPLPFDRLVFGPRWPIKVVLLRNLALVNVVDASKMLT